MTKKEIDEFLRNGGTLLRLVKTGKKCVLQRKNKQQDWYNAITNASEDILRNTVDKLVKSHPTLFKEIEPKEKK